MNLKLVKALLKINKKSKVKIDIMPYDLFRNNSKRFFEYTEKETLSNKLFFEDYDSSFESKLKSMYNSRLFYKK